MVATFVIGLREGLEAALIVGIIAAFLGRRGRSDALRLMWIGVVAAVAICAAVGIGLQVLSANLPQQQQEALETVLGVAAVVVVTYMIFWMRRHARSLRRDLESAAASALDSGADMALVGTAFLAVLREGFETSVFLLAAFQASVSPLAAGVGALAGIVVAAALGYLLYRGAVRIDLARFFRLTGVMLVIVAAGLVATAAHTAHEAGWLNLGQATLLDLSWLVSPGSLQSALITAVLGIQPQPTLIEVLAWLTYLVPMLIIVAWPAARRPQPVPVTAGVDQPAVVKR